MLNHRIFLTALTVLAASYTTNAAAQWRTIGHSNEQRFESAVVFHQGKIIAFNGFSPAINIVNSVEQYNPSTNNWSTIAQTESGLGNAVTHTGAVVVGNNVWLIGGRVGNHPGAVSNKVWIFNTQNRKWTRGPNLPRPFAGGGAALVGNKIHVFGGIDAQGRCDVNYHYTYDIRGNNSWVDITSQAAMPLPRNHFSTVVANNKIYALGGQKNHDPCRGAGPIQLKQAHVFNPANNNWTRLPDLPFNRSHAEPSSFLHDGLIYMAGGATNGDKVITFNPGTKKWNTRGDLTLPVPLIAPAARIINNRLIVAMGGENGPRGSSTATRELVLPGGTASINTNAGNNNSTSAGNGSSITSNATATLDFSNSNTPTIEPDPLPPTVVSEPAPPTIEPDPVVPTFVANTAAHCTVSAAWQPRNDCDPVNGEWTCSSVNVESLTILDLISSTPVESSADSSDTNRDTAPQQCIDTDGDGYGWDGTATCIIDGITPVIHACIDSDGDGFGWNGRETCFP